MKEEKTTAEELEGILDIESSDSNSALEAVEDATGEVEEKKLPKAAPKKKVLTPKTRLKADGEKKPLKKKRDIMLFTRIPLSEKIFFAENLRVMVKAGLSISEALETLALQTQNKSFHNTLLEIKEGVMKGNMLGDMLIKYPKIFSNFFINMVRVGEVSGNLEKNLQELTIQMKKDHELTSKVRGAMIYPAVVVVATIGIGILMFIYVIPNVISVFAEVQVKLPLATRMLILISTILTDYGIFAGLSAIALIAGFIFGIRTEKGKKIWDKLLLGMWIIGPIVKKVNLARFSRTTSALLKTDIPVVESFKITSTILGNVFYKNICLKVSQQITQGTAINSILKEEPKLFPPMVTEMVLVGEKSGTLDELLNEIAVFYEEEVYDITRNLSSIIEPILIVFLGVVVGFMAFAIISPIYTLTQNL